MYSAGTNGIAKRAVRALRVWLFAAQHKQARDGEHIKDQHGKNHVVQQRAVEIAVGFRRPVTASRKRVRGSTSTQVQMHCSTSPTAGHAAGVQLPSGLEEKPVARHRVVDTRAGEDDPVVTAKRRNHDRHRHDGRPLPPNTVSMAAVATRSSGAFLICSSGSRQR